MPEQQAGGTRTCVMGSLREAKAAEQFASLHVALEELRPETGGKGHFPAFLFLKVTACFFKGLG